MSHMLQSSVCKCYCLNASEGFPVQRIPCPYLPNRLETHENGQNKKNAHAPYADKDSPHPAHANGKTIKQRMHVKKHATAHVPSNENVSEKGRIRRILQKPCKKNHTTFPCRSMLSGNLSI